MGFRASRSARLLAAVAVVSGILVAAATLAACGSGGTAVAGTTAASTTTAAATAAGSITVTDDTGHQVTLASPASRVVSLAPANTEMAYAVGGGSKLVAGTSYDDYPPQAKSLPKIGDFANPSVEKIVSMNPDLVLAAGGIQAGLRSKLENLGVRVYVVDPSTLAQTMVDLQNLGALLGTRRQADALVQRMQAAIKAVTDKVAGLPKPTVFFEVYPKPLMTAGTHTFIDDLIRLAGGTNIADSAGSGYLNFSTEVLIQDNPDVYIAPIGSQANPGQIAKRPGYGQLKAVQDHRVFTIPDDIVVRPGPRLVQGLQELARMFHPGAFSAK
jgi:iron complex transport system substrate-binding protein